MDFAPREKESRPDWLRTAEVLEQTGITHQVLYRYVTLGLLGPAQTSPTGVRYFHPRVILTINTIKSITQDGGYSLRDLKDIFFKDARVKRAVGDGSEAPLAQGPGESP